MDLFAGCDSFTGERRDPAVKGTAGPPRDSRVVYHATVCRSSDEVRLALSLSSKESATLPGLGSADIKQRYVGEMKMTSTSVAMVVYVGVIIGVTSFHDVQLLPDAGVPATEEAVGRFIQVHGDSWVSSVSLGSEYWATYMFETASLEQQSELAAELAVGGEVYGVDIEKDVRAKVTAVIQKSRARLDFKQMATGYAGTLPSTREEAFKFASEFPGKEHPAPTVVECELQGYEHVPHCDFHGLWKPVSRSRELFLRHDRPMQSIIPQLGAIRELVNQGDLLNDIYRTYGYAGDHRLDEVMKQARNDLEALEATAEGVAREPWKEWRVPSTQSLGAGIPQLNVTLQRSFRYGGEGGDEHPGPDLSYVQQRKRFAGLTAHTNGIVTMLDLVWRDPEQREYHDQYGTDGGDSHSISLAKDEYVTSVRLRTGDMLDQVSITTSHGQALEFGGGGGSSHGPMAFHEGGCSFLGFYGRAGWRVDGLGTVGAAFSPATWAERKVR